MAGEVSVKIQMDAENERSENLAVFVKTVEAVMEEYINEFEHQDGSEVWEMMTPDEIAEDFAIFVQALGADVADELRESLASSRRCG
jgi:hypothetical protein